VAALTLATLGARRIDVTRIGKAGTFGLMVAFPFFLAGHSSVGWHHLALTLGWIAAIGGLFFGWISVGVYVPLAQQAFREGRAQRDAATR
jgi:uncharacterized membrane protein (DUF485 family)